MPTTITNRWKMVSLALLFAAMLGTVAPGAAGAAFRAPLSVSVTADSTTPPCCPPYYPKCPGNTIWG